ncbi:MAG TPA: hypothetical protein VJB89_03425 [Candidatus Nanoarchaeia archaeon]|nr:hypothetical protein [Candidatus Nanoarchaeia archaeon]
MVKLKEKDFIKLDYTGRIKENNEIFDLTSEELAKKEKIYNKEFKYGSKIICIGQKEIIPAIDEFLIDKEENKSYILELNPEKAFGKRDPKLIKIISTQNLIKQKINPYPGLSILNGNMFGIIKSVTPGRTLVDFNHPLSSKSLIYELETHEIIKDSKIKLQNLIKNSLNQNPKIEIIENKATIELNLPEQTQKMFIDIIKNLIPELKEITLKKQPKK